MNRSFMLCLSCCGILAIAVGFAVLTIYDLERESAYWEDQNSMSLEIIEQYQDREAEYESTVSQLERESAYWKSQNSMSLEVIEQYENQISASLEIIEQYQDRESEHESTVGQLEREYVDLEYEFDDFYYSFYGDGTKFLTIIEDGMVIWDFVDSKGNEYYWEMSMQSYEELVLDGASVSLNDNRRPISLNDRVFNTIQYEQFVVGGFTDTVDDIYHNSENNSDFIWEIWWIVSQMTVYQTDVDERSEGRFALETFTRQGGDCEDLAILIADMLASSQYTQNWTIQLGMIDSDNPTDPHKVNHVIVFVNDGHSDYLIEATASPSWGWYSEGVEGWWYDVDV